MPPPSITPASQSSWGLAHLVPTPQPDVYNRQASEPNDLITLSITRDTTTFTTVIVLGGTAAPSTNNYQSAPATSIDSGSSLTTAAPVSNGSTGMPPTTNYLSTSSTTTVSGSSPTTAAPVSNGSTGTPSSVIIGAVLGSIFGSIFCLALIWFCCYSPYRPKFPLTGPFYDDDGTELGSWESESRKSSRRRRSSFRTGEVVVVSRPVSKKASHGGRSSYRSSGGRVSARSHSEVRVERIYERPDIASGRPLRDRDVRPLGRELASPDSF